MFTGLVEDVGVLAARTLTGKAGKLEVTTALPLAGQAGGVIQTFQAISGK